MKFNFTCECKEDISNVVTYDNRDGYFLIKGVCPKCNKEQSVDLTDYLDMDDDCQW
ncbi:MAG: hypothetical protein ACRDD7_13940 [Peptostreptococcaceae bacterium]